MEWKCWQHDDCFALNEYGRCEVLNDVQFKGACPFYKTKKQYEKEEEERKRAYERNI